MSFPFRAELKDLAPYPPGKPIEELQREYGLTRIAKLASNENPYGPSPRAVEAIRKSAESLHYYPESGCHYLRGRLAEKLGVPQDLLFFGNGSDEIVALLTMAYLEDGTNIVCSEHTFIRYEMGAMAMGAATIHVPLKDWHHDVEGLLAAVNPQTRILFVGNPDNPVGTALPTARLRQLLENVPENVIVVVDEAYYEFAARSEDYPDTVHWLSDFPNLVITRTFSKAYGLAGLRIGYAIGNPEIWNVVDRVRPPFNVSRIAQDGAMAALDDTEHLDRTIDGNAAGLATIYAALDGLGIEYVPSRANFVLMNMKRPAIPVYESLLQRGVIVRPMGIYQLPEHLRVSVGLPWEIEFFVENLTSALRG